MDILFTNTGTYIFELKKVIEWFAMIRMRIKVSRHLGNGDISSGKESTSNRRKPTLKNIQMKKITTIESHEDQK